MPQRREILKGAGASGLVLTAGCLESSTGDGDDGGSTTHVGIVFALGGLGDNGFNDTANRGVEKAADEFDIEFNRAQPEKATQFKTNQQRFSESNSPDYDIICCIGFLQQSALKETSENFTDQKFMLVDSVVERDNVANYIFKEHEGSFQVGHIAGLLTQQDFSAGAGETKSNKTKVGFVGGKESPLIRKFEAGYKAGVKHASSDIEITSNYVGSFTDPVAGKEAAISMYDNGADIIYPAAGNSSSGVYKAAQERGRFTIGVDSDVSKSQPKFSDVTLASMVKRVDTATFNAIKSVKNDTFEGKTNSLGLEKNGISAVWGTDLESEIPDDVKSGIEDSRKKIINDDISVPKEP